MGQAGKRRTFGWEICGSGVRIPHRQHDTNTAAAADAEADAEADAAAAVVSSGPFLASADAADAADGAHARRSNTRLGLWARLCLAARGEAACDWREHAQAIGGQV